jgi:hypothetical protein
MQVSRAGCFAITVGLSCVDVNETVPFRGGVSFMVALLNAIP